MRIRLFKKTDMDEVSKLFVESSLKEPKEKKWSLECSKQYITMLIRINKDLCFVATEGDKIIGVSLSILQPEFNRNILQSRVLLVHPNYRRQKVGTKLMRKTCIKAENKYGIKEIEIQVYTLNNFPISWYDNLSFRKRKNYEVARAKISEVLKII